MTGRRAGVLTAIGAAGLVLLGVAIGSRITAGATGDPRESARIAAREAPFAAADRVPVLCYHYVRGPSGPFHLARVFGYVVLSLPVLDDSELWKVSRRGFERQIEYLARRGYTTVTLDELHEWQMGRRVLPVRSVVITFDDADESVYEYAYPVLKKYGFKATLFVVTAQTGRSWNGVRCLDWKRLHEMQQSGVFDIESHTHDLHFKVGERNHARPVFLATSEAASAGSVGARWDDELFHDLTRSRAAIERHVGRTPRYLAWPYGFGNVAVNQIALDAGFQRTCSLRGRPARRVSSDRLMLADTERFEIPRYTITARTSLRVFREMLQGTYTPSR